MATNNNINKTCDTFTATVGVFLPTTGGTPTILDFNEEGTLTRTWSGIWASPQSGNILYSRTGKKVTLQITLGSAAATTASSIVLDTVLPSYLRPVNTVYVPMIVNDNTAPLNGACNIQSGGLINIFAGIVVGNFSGLSTLGFSGLFANFVVSYMAS